MNDQDYIKTAVEQADGWSFNADGDIYGPFGPIGFGLTLDVQKWDLAALAAQLTEQVDAIEEMDMTINQLGTTIWNGFLGAVIAAADGPNRTMNTIKVVVDSKVLIGS